jgi:hypothetical protein
MAQLTDEPHGGMTGRRDLAICEDGTGQGSVLRMAGRSAGKSQLPCDLPCSNVHIFVRPHRHARELAQYFETVLGSPVWTVEFPGID